MTPGVRLCRCYHHNEEWKKGGVKLDLCVYLRYKAALLLFSDVCWPALTKVSERGVFRCASQSRATWPLRPVHRRGKRSQIDKNGFLFPCTPLGVFSSAYCKTSINVKRTRFIFLGGFVCFVCHVFACH